MRHAVYVEAVRYRCVRASRTDLLLPLSSRPHPTLQCVSALPAVPAVGMTMVVSPIPMLVSVIAAMMVVSPVPMRMPVIAVVPGSYDYGRSRIHDGWGWGDKHRCGVDRHANANGDTDPSVS
jgi:hypothetical protein